MIDNPIITAQVDTESSVATVEIDQVNTLALPADIS